MKKLSIKNLVKLSFKSEGEINKFPEKRKAEGVYDYLTCLQEMLKRVLQGEMKGHKHNSKPYRKKKRSH